MGGRPGAELLDAAPFDAKEVGAPGGAGGGRPRQAEVGKRKRQLGGPAEVDVGAVLERAGDGDGGAHSAGVPARVDEHRAAVELWAEDRGVEDRAARADFDLEVARELAGGAEEELHHFLLVEG